MSATITKDIGLDKKELDDLCVNTIRFLAVDAVEKAQSGHPGMPMEAAVMGYILFTRLLRHNPKNPEWPNRDRFVLSAGHGSMLLYALLHLAGYGISLEELKNFRQWGSKTPGHPEYGETPGVETTTGPLGQGFGSGVGMALAQRYQAHRFNRPGHEIIDHKIYVFCSDGDMMEGVSSEAASIAGHQKLSSLIYVYLDNKISIDGSTSLAMSEDVKKRFEAYGWFVQNIDGNDAEGFEKAVLEAQKQKEKPSLIIARTHIGYGSPNKQDTAEAHGAPLGAEEAKLAKKNLEWPLEPTFYVPEEVYEKFGQAIPRGEALEAEWKKMYNAWSKEYPDLAIEWERRSDLPEGWDSSMPLFDSKEGNLPTRQASGKVLNTLADRIPALIGGSADLMDSTNVRIKSSKDALPENPGGRNIHFGVREHAMGTILNGMALYGGLVPFGSTFLIFSDYMRPAIRLAAIMKAKAIYAFTHDSIGLGEDGPTHQSIDQLASLRAIPNLTVIRPADANETSVAWHVAMQIRNGPVALILTRQKVPILDRGKLASAEGLRKGAYILSEAPNGRPDIILISTGSEVFRALQAQEKLKQLGVNARVVSMPSWELFESQPKEYKDYVLPKEVKKRISIEAASVFGWERYVGSEGVMIGMRRFGASAPGEVLMQKFGFTAENIVEKSLELLGRA
jgi:transketolase